MAELKTKQQDTDVYEFINTFANTEQKREDSLEPEQARRGLAISWFFAPQSGNLTICVYGKPGS